MRRWLAGWIAIAVLAGLPGPGCRAPGGASAKDPASLSEAERERRLARRVEAQTHYAAGVSAEINGDQPRALTHFTAAAMADLSSETLVADVAGRLLQAGRTEEAIQVLLAATRRPGASGYLDAWLGLAYASGGDIDRAIQANRLAIRKDPLLLLGHLNLANLWWQQGDQEQVLRLLDEAAGRGGASPEFLVAIAELYLDYDRRGFEGTDARNRRVLDLLDRARAAEPREAVLRQRLADAYRQIQEWDKAEAIYLDLLRHEPPLPLIRESLAELYLRSGQSQKAIEQLEAITRDDPRNERASYYLGTLVLEDRRYAQAEDLFQKILLLAPGLEPAYYYLAAVKLALDKPDEALTLLSEARQRFPPRFLIEFYAGLAHATRKDYDQAVAHFTGAELLAKTGEPDRLTALFYFQYGAACERRGDYAQAEACFRKSLELEPDFSEALNYLGYMWADRGENLEEARQLIERAVELEPDNAAYLDSLGWVLFRLEQPEEALKWILKAIDCADKPDPTLYDHLGDIHARLGDLERARDAWRKALALEDNDTIRRKLEAFSAGNDPTP